MRPAVNHRASPASACDGAPGHRPGAGRLGGARQLIAASVIAGVYVVFTLFTQWLGGESSGHLLLDGALLVVIFAVLLRGLLPRRRHRALRVGWSPAERATG